MKNKISQGEFNFRSWCNCKKGINNILDFLTLTATMYEKSIEDINNDTSISLEKQEELQDLQNRLKSVNIIKSDSKLMSDYEALFTFNRINLFVQCVFLNLRHFNSGETKIKNGYINDYGLRFIDVAADDFGLDLDDLLEYIEGKTSFEVLEQMYNMAGYEFPKEKVEIVDGNEIFVDSSYIIDVADFILNQKYIIPKKIEKVSILKKEKSS